MSLCSFWYISANFCSCINLYFNFMVLEFCNKQTHIYCTNNNSCESIISLRNKQRCCRQIRKIYIFDAKCIGVIS